MKISSELKDILLIFGTISLVVMAIFIVTHFFPSNEKSSAPIIADESTTEFWECSKEETTSWNYFEQIDNYDRFLNFYYPVNFPTRINKEPVETVCFKKLVFNYTDMSSLRCDTNYINCENADYNYSYCAAGKHPVKTCVEWIYKKKLIKPSIEVQIDGVHYS
jgi:hypothetical protein